MLIGKPDARTQARALWGAGTSLQAGAAQANEAHYQAPGHTDLMVSPEAIDKWFEESRGDPVFRPNHYARYIIEPATFIAANKLPFDVGNVVKYVLRFDAKGGREDVLKARRYCDMLLERLDREQRVADGARAEEVWKEAL